jgi:AcrR family transcriptional regulator
MTAKSEATRARILEAAIDEFARHGIAGGRIDRIASAAGANKERIYAYFGDKRALFDAALDAAIRTAKREFPRRMDDLPGSIGAMAEYAVRDRRILRLLDWSRLELDEPDGEAVGTETRAQLEAIAAAQQSGDLDSSWHPADLLILLSALGTAWAQAPAALRTARGDDPEHIREAIEEAVRRIITPAE